ncbi:TraR/DksA C4-type zinc finger protein [Kribbella sp. NPDC048915]|uniref:TraR/DksA family transcriptional regulator n=1 Tax=Kribbella sp. NPDC048915 TaxID=3155148 RepID=UPI0033FAA79B
MNQGSPSPQRPSLDVELFREELGQQRQFRLEQLIRLSYEATAPCPEAQAEVRAVLTAGAKQALAEIDAALFRITKGRFGVCEICGDAISVHQLEAIPTTRLCLRCEHRRRDQARSPRTRSSARPARG